MNSSAQHAPCVDILDSTRIQHESALESLTRFVTEDRAPPGMELYSDQQSSLSMNTIPLNARRRRSGSMDTLVASFPLKRRSNSFSAINGSSLTHVRLSRVPLRPSEAPPPYSRPSINPGMDQILGGDGKAENPWIINPNSPRTTEKPHWLRRVIHRVRHSLDEPDSDKVLHRAGVDAGKEGNDPYQPPIEIPYFHTARYHISCEFPIFPTARSRLTSSFRSASQA